MAARELFVWYRVRRERADATRAAVVVAQSRLRSEWPGLKARLLVRDDGEPSTWMETYSLLAPGSGDNAGIDLAIEAAIAAAALRLEALLDGPRHVESFDVVA